jgi:hypothetical protein
MAADQLRAVRRATTTLDRRRKAVEEAEREWREAIRAALAAGTSPSVVAAAAKITRQRVHQIRDNTR